MRRAVGVVAIAAGLMLIGFTFAEHVFSRSRDAQRISDQYRSLMSAGGLADLRSGFESVKAAGAQLDSQAEPRLRAELGMTQADFDAYLAREMPGIAHFDAQAPTVVGIVDPVIAKMEAARSDYHRADQIPTGFLSMTSAPWLFLGFGTLLVAAGAVVVRRPSRLPLAALGAIGLVVAIAPLAIGIPGKVDAARRVTKVGAIGLAPATGQRAVAATAVFDGMVADVTGKLEPALAAKQGLEATAGQAGFARDFPALSGFASNWHSGISAKSHALSDSQVAFAPVFANANRIPLRPIPWMFIVSGAVLALLAGASLAPLRRGSQVRLPAPSVSPAG